MSLRRIFGMLAASALFLTQLPALPAFASQATADGLGAYWKFDETSGTSAADSSGDGITGTHQNGPTISSVVPPTAFSNARSLSFDGSNDYVSAGAVRTQGRAAFTYSVWIKTSDSTDAHRTIFGEGRTSTDTGTYHVQLTSDGDTDCTVNDSFKVYMQDDAGTVATFCSTSTYNDGQWHHVAVVSRAANDHELYVDGTEVGSSSTTIGSTTFDTASIGALRRTTVTQYFPGLIDDMRVYERALGTAEIADLAAGRHTAATWDGSSTTGFENSANWSTDAVPDPYTRVTIPATLNRLTLTGAIKAAALTVHTGGLINLNGAGFTMNDAGTFTNYGTLALRNSETLSGLTVPADKGAIMIVGTGSRTGFVTGNSYHDLILNDGLVGYWKFDETSGARAADASGYGSSGSLVNGVTLSSTVAPTQFYNPQALSFDGTNDYADMADGFSDFAKGMTVAVWAKPTSSANYARFIDFGNADASDNILFARKGTSGDLVFEVYSGSSGRQAVATGALINNSWHHYAATLLPSGAVTLYRDGRVVGRGTTNIPQNVRRTLNYVGRSNWAADAYYAGGMDDMRVWNRPLSQTEIAGLASGSQPASSSGTITLDNNLSVGGNLVLNGKRLDAASTYMVSISGSLLINGGSFQARGGTVTLDGGNGSHELLSGGQWFNRLQIDGGATWDMRDRLVVSGALVLQGGTLDATTGNHVLRAGTFSSYDDVFVPRSGTVVLTSAADAYLQLAAGSAFNTLRVEDATEEGLVGYWKFDEGNGGTIRDASPYANYGARSGTGLVWTGSTLASSLSFHFDNPYALRFNGSNDAVIVPDDDALDPGTGDFTVSAWVKGRSMADADIFFGKSNGGGTSASYGYLFGIWDSLKPTIHFATSGASHGKIQSATSLSNNRWYHVAIVVDRDDSSNCVVYIDGAATTTTVSNLSSHTGDISNSVSLAIGSESDGGAHWDGEIDDARVYDRALSAHDVMNLARGQYAHGDRGTATVTTSGDVTAAGLALDSGNMTLQNDLALSGPLTMLRGRGALNLGGGTTTLVGLIMSGSTVTGGSGDLDVNWDVQMLTGSLVAPSATLHLLGNWLQSGGTFDANGGTVLLDGTSQTINGSSTFYNLTKTVAAADTLYFGSGKTVTVEGTLMLKGAASNLLSLRSNNDGSPWYLDPAGARTISYVDVRDSSNQNATAINCVNKNCTDSGNNVNWTFIAASSSSSASSASSSAGSTPDQGGSGGGGRRGEGTGLEAALRAKTAILERYRRTVVLDDEDDAPATVPKPGTQPTDELPDRINGYAISQRRNRLVLVAGDAQLLYRDVLADSWYAPYVANVIEHNIARGYKDEAGRLTGEFGVSNAVTRAEILKMVLEASGKSTDKAPPPRNATAIESWASPYVGIAEQMQLSVFALDADVHASATRGEVVQIILEALGITIGRTPASYEDVPPDHPYSHAIAAAAFFGIVEGDTDAEGRALNTFRPDEAVNRAEAAKIVSLAKALIK